MLLAQTALSETVLVTAGRGYSDPTAQGTSNVALTPGVKSSKNLPTPELIAARKALVAKQKVSMRLVRQLADLGDGFASYRYAQYLEEKNNPKITADVAHYYGIASATGRGGAMRGMVNALSTLDPETTTPGRLRELKKVFIAYAAAGNSHAVEAVSRFHFAGQPFGDLTQDINAVLAKNSGLGASKLSLQLASAILQDPEASIEDVERAKGYLATASASKSLSISLIAQNLTQLADATLAKTPAKPTELPEKEVN